VALAALALLALPCSAAERTLRVCAEPDNLPLSNVHEAGFENRIARVVADELRSTLVYEWQPQRRGFVRKTIGADVCDVWIGVPAGLERVLTTRPYYRSGYVFLSRADAREPLASFADPRLATLRIGVQLIGNDLAASPPALALARAGATDGVVGYPVYGEGSAEAGKVQEKCGGATPGEPCPGILGTPIKAGGAGSAVGQIKGSFAGRGLSKEAVKAKKPLSKLARASTTVAEKSKKAECTRAMRCLLRPYDGEKDGVTGCCPGQTPHHIPPWSTFSEVAGNTVSHGKALCVCLEGAGHSIGSHGKHHHGINFLLEQSSRVGGVAKGTSKGDTVFKGPLSEHVKVAAAVTEAQNGCSKECIEEQLNQQFGEKQLKKQATHNASTTGGTEHALMDGASQQSALSALNRAPSIG